ncbi:hypothetical protein D3C80_1625860 [compost metagenome]
MSGLIEVVRGLHGQAAAVTQLTDQVRVQRAVIGHPLQRGIGQDQVLRLGGGPAGDIGNCAAHPRDAQALTFTGLGDHVRIAVQGNHLGIRVALQQHFGRIARAAAQVNGMADRAWRHGAEQVAHGAGAFVFKQRILGGGPSHGGLLWAGNGISISHVQSLVGAVPSAVPAQVVAGGECGTLSP